ncbi:meiotic expression up-regulated 26 [Fusarium heterosporum]|uniref:Meiotic expression up-regulated 26 n=1 Tax=Fusarium heterosporum TaxID=42747 RepID=A0A8H5WIR2_FUSHE|nr:meiotic expression up-regulated 26 [Fusarium heterosporum]
MSSPTINMNTNDFAESQSVVSSDVIWSAPASQSKPLPAPIYGDLPFYSTEDLSSVPYWDMSSVPYQQSPSGSTSRLVSMHQIPNCMDYDITVSMGNSFTTDKGISVLDPKQGTLIHGDLMTIGDGSKQRRLSGSLLYMPKFDIFSGIPYDDLSTALSEVPSFTSDYLPTYNHAFAVETHLLAFASPEMTPQLRTSPARTRGRGQVTSPSAQPGDVRSAPYSVDGLRSKRLSIVTYRDSASRRPTQYLFRTGEDMYSVHQLIYFGHSAPAMGAAPMPLQYGSLQAMQQEPFVVPRSSVFQRNSMRLPAQLPFQVAQQQQWQPDSNGDPSCLNSYYTDLSNPPDLYSALQEKEISPPLEDMNPGDPGMIPREQKLRFESDLYTPRWQEERNHLVQTALPLELYSMIITLLEQEDLSALLRASKQTYPIIEDILYDHEAKSPRPAALLWAAKKGRMKVAKKAIDALKCQCTSKAVQCQCTIRPILNEALWLALSERCTNIAEFLLGQGADPSKALCLASSGEYINIVRFFLDQGADPMARGAGRETALKLASLHRHNEILQILLAVVD